MATNIDQNVLIDAVLSKIYCFSVNHKNAPLSLIGKLQVTDVEKEIHLLKERLRAKELVILQTCNRFEVYCYVNDENNDVKSIIKDYLTQLAGYNIEKYVNIIRGREAIEHLFRVAAGLESLVIGEWEIIDQVREALKISGRANSVGKVLSTIFKKAVSVGASVRKNEKGMIGVPEIAVEFANKFFGGLDGKRIMIVGTGKAALAIIKTINSFKIKRLIIAGRSIEKVNKLAMANNGYGILLADVIGMLKDVDVVFIAISGKYFTLQIDHDNIPLIIDISIPSAVLQIDQTGSGKVFTLKTLENQIQQNVDAHWIQSTEFIIKETMISLDKFLIKIAVDDFISKLMTYIENMRKDAVSYALRKLKNGGDTENIIDAMSRSLVKRSMQPIIEGILSLAYKEDGSALQLLKYLNNNIKN